MSRPHPTHRPYLLTLLLAAAAVAPAHAFQAPPAGRVLPRIDVRDREPIRPAGAQATSAAAGAIQALEQQAGQPLRVRWNAASGRPEWVHAYGAPLGPVGGTDAESTARGFLAAQAGLAGFTPAEVAALRLSFVQRDSSGATHVGFAQEAGGVPVFEGDLRVHLDRLGRVVAVRLGAALPGLDGGARPAMSPVEAARRAAAAAGIAGLDDLAPRHRLATQPLELGSARLARPIRTDLVWFPLAGGARLAWRSLVSPPGYPALYQVLVDATTGEVLYRANLMTYADTRADVFADNPDRAPRTRVTFYDDAVNLSLAFPLGWLTGNTTVGNNVYAQDDRAGDDEATPGLVPAATAGTPQVFDPPYSADPFADRALGVLNLFYGVNIAHERFYRLGFDEPSGNYQSDNFGRGGMGGDPVLGDAQDEADTLADADPGNDVANNANFSPAADGTPGRIQMYLWNSPLPLRDGDLDMDVIIHEYAHGVSSRLVGGLSDGTCLVSVQAGAMGEAWSDFFAGSYFDDPRVGEYATQDFVNGIRTGPMSADTYTYGDLCQVAAQCEVHADGEIWAQALWEMRARLIAAHGPGEGVRRAEQLAIDGMKHAPCQPSFLDARDAILLADELRYGGSDLCLLWSVFAQNGMGTAAQDNTGGDQQQPIEDFSQPAWCSGGSARVIWEFDTIGCNRTARVRVFEPDLVPATVELSSAAGDQETLVVGPVAGLPGVYLTQPFTVAAVPAPAGVVPGNGTLEAVRGDTLTALYRDAAGDIAEPATLRCLANVELGAYRFTRGTCDTDQVPGYPELPGFLDAGESAVLEVELLNRENFDLEGVVVTLGSSNPAVAIVPATTVNVARMPHAIGSAAAPTVLRFLATAQPSVVTGDTADLTITLTANGFEGTAAPIRWTIRLNLDYQVVPRSLHETFDPGSPTLASWTHAPTRATPTGDEWRTVTCKSSSPTSSYKNGGGDPACGDYSDNQGDPYLAAPGIIVLPPGAEAAKLRRLQYDHWIQLAVPSDPFGGACDAEAVGVFATNDPASLDTTDPLGLLPNALAAYTVVPALGINNNTTGWVHEDLDLTNRSLPVDFTRNTFLTWLLLVDFTNALVPAPCTFFDVQGEGYYLDEVQLDWEEVLTVPQAAACTPSCLALAQSDPAGAETCAQSQLPLSGAPSLVTGCNPGLEYRWSGGELGAGAWGPSPVANVQPAASTVYRLEVACRNDPTCADSLPVPVVTGPQPPAGGPIANALLAARIGANVHLDWSRRPLAPRAYNLHEAARAQDVTDAAIGSQPSVRIDDAETHDTAVGGAAFYEVYGRDACTGLSVIP